MSNNNNNMDKQREQLVNDGVQSIRRLSFIESYGIKEVEDEAGSISSDDDKNNNYKSRQSLSIADLTDADVIDIDVTTRTNNCRHDISLLGFDNSHPSNDNDNKKDDPFNDSSKPPPNFAGGGERRRGSKQRRMRQRLGLGAHKESFGDSRRASTGTIVSCCFNCFVYFFT